MAVAPGTKQGSRAPGRTLEQAYELLHGLKTAAREETHDAEIDDSTSPAVEGPGRDPRSCDGA